MEAHCVLSTADSLSHCVNRPSCVRPDALQWSIKARNAAECCITPRWRQTQCRVSEFCNTCELRTKCFSVLQRLLTPARGSRWQCRTLHGSHCQPVAMATLDSYHKESAFKWGAPRQSLKPPLTPGLRQGLKYVDMVLRHAAAAYKDASAASLF